MSPFSVHITAKGVVCVTHNPETPHDMVIDAYLIVGLRSLTNRVAVEDSSQG
jgi:hypothetical protein